MDEFLCFILSFPQTWETGSFNVSPDSVYRLCYGRNDMICYWVNIMADDPVLYTCHPLPMVRNNVWTRTGHQ